jgi:RHS repeat-associated protein
MWSRHPAFAVSKKQYRYSGKEKDDETGLYYYGARYYLPWIGRWLCCDPVGPADVLNLYCYVSNNPILYIDLSGHNGSSSVEEGPVEIVIGEIEIIKDQSVSLSSSELPTTVEDWETAFKQFSMEQDYEAFEQAVGNLKDQKTLPMTAGQKTVDQDVLTEEHDEAVKKVINEALKISIDRNTDPISGELTVSKQDIIKYALYSLIVPLRHRSLEDSQNLIFRDADHYFSGWTQEWQCHPSTPDILKAEDCASPSKGIALFTT